MDKGLDIEERRCVAAYHAAVADSAPKLAEFSCEFAHSRAAGASIAAIKAVLSSVARRLDSELDWPAAERALAWAEAPLRRIVTIFDPGYPDLLKQIAVPPVLLFVHGRADALDAPQLAIVGSRKGTHYGLETAYRFAGNLAGLGFTVTSGLAAGIDGAAHRGALDAGGQTVAVFGCGIERTYPKRHQKLAEKIVQRGALISEFPIGSPPRPYHFPRRNRIISGLSCGTLVIEAAARSGSISTAMHALEQGREVFAVPGSIRNPMAAGCHRLLKQGATLVDEIEDVVVQLPFALKPVRKPKMGGSPAPSREFESMTKEEQRLLDACGYDAATFDDIVRRSGLTATEVSSILSALEVRGVVRSVAGNAYLRTEP